MIPSLLLNDQCLGPKVTVYSMEIDFKHSWNFQQSSPHKQSLAILFIKVVLIVQL